MKFRIQRGSQRGRVAKLNEEQVKNIRFYLEQGERQNKLAKEFNVDQSTISYIKTNHTWVHV